LNDRYGLPFESWYGCQQADCLQYPTPSSVAWTVGSQSGTISEYTAVCGNAHFPPNTRQHYDIVHDGAVNSSCRGYRRAGGPRAGDPIEPIDASAWSQYKPLAGDCTGAWIVWWWQSFPGADRKARAADGTPMKNWWPFIYY
jgi:hypothetical protein